MRILAFCPSEREGVSGNVITLRRVRRAISARGHLFEIVFVKPSTEAEEAKSEVREFDPDVVHYYHAYKTGRLLPSIDERASVVTLSGTDVNHDWEDPAKGADLERALEGAARLVTYNPSLRERVLRAAPRFLDKLEVIPKGVDAGEEPFDLREKAGIEPGCVVFFLPGGIRPVKNNLFAADGLEPLVRSGHPIRLVFAGPILDRFYGKLLAQRLQSSTWIRHLEEIPHEAMLSALRGADVVLNTSQSEGISNAIMEAMWAGRAVLASDIPGNRDLLRDGETGVLFNPGEFEEKAKPLASDPGRREALGRAAAAFAHTTFSADREADALLEVYSDAVRPSKR